tara:strand:+ start:4297 stop:4509 length:213 start_codon:yes stop_codon:yes gene_type:complete
MRFSENPFVRIPYQTRGVAAPENVRKKCRKYSEIWWTGRTISGYSSISHISQWHESVSKWFFVVKSGKRW